MVANKRFTLLRAAILALLVTSTGASTVGGSSGAHPALGRCCGMTAGANSALPSIFLLVNPAAMSFHKGKFLRGSWSSIIGTY